jgi:hypothetical protein
MVIGILAVLPIGVVLEYMSLAGETWRGVDTFVVFVGALAIGAPAGNIYFKLYESSLRKPR